MCGRAARVRCKAELADTVFTAPHDHCIPEPAADAGTLYGWVNHEIFQPRITSDPCTHGDGERRSTDDSSLFVTGNQLFMVGRSDDVAEQGLGHWATVKTVAEVEHELADSNSVLVTVGREGFDGWLIHAY